MPPKRRRLNSRKNVTPPSHSKRDDASQRSQLEHDATVLHQHQEMVLDQTGPHNEDSPSYFHTDCLGVIKEECHEQELGQAGSDSSQVPEEVVAGCSSIIQTEEEEAHYHCCEQENEQAAQAHSQSEPALSFVKVEFDWEKNLDKEKEDEVLSLYPQEDLVLDSPKPPSKLLHMDPEERYLMQLSDNISSSVKNHWFMSHRGPILQLVELSYSKNPVLEKVITVTNFTVQIFVCSYALPPTHDLHLKYGGCFIGEDLQSLSQRLIDLSRKMQGMKVCRGCSDLKYKELWTSREFSLRGFFEIPRPGESRFRSKKCELLILETDVCKACHSEHLNLVREYHKCRGEEELLKESKTPMKLLCRTELELALQQTRRLCKRYHRQIQQLCRKMREQKDRL